jgi:O-acetyl-ADP-ribose deacetylase (regulator of RNase III)
MPFNIVRQDITRMQTDAIVNAANTNLARGGGVCGAIFKAAGADMLQAACDKLAPIKTGEAVITPGFNLPAKYVIHAAGPIYRLQDPPQSEELLRAAYINSMKRAAENNCESIAFPLISSGIYGYPKAEALRVAAAAIQDFLTSHDMDISLVVFDKTAFAVSTELLGEVASYIDEHYVDEHSRPRQFPELFNVEEKALDISVFYESVPAPMAQKPQAAEMPAAGLDGLIEELDEPFSKALLRLIDTKGRTDAEVYKRANIDRKLFSKIRNPDYRPGKKTALALAVALELSLDETDDLLKRAGYALSRAVKFDVIVEYFITRRKYDIFEINEVLFHYDQPLLGG